MTAQSPMPQRSLQSMNQTIPVFIGVDPRERAATNVLIDSLVQHSSVPLTITPMLTPQLELKVSIGASAIPSRAQRSRSAAFWCPT